MKKYLVFKFPFITFHKTIVSSGKFRGLLIIRVMGFGIAFGKLFTFNIPLLPVGYNKKAVDLVDKIIEKLYSGHGRSE